MKSYVTQYARINEYTTEEGNTVKVIFHHKKRQVKNILFVVTENDEVIFDFDEKEIPYSDKAVNALQNFTVDFMKITTVPENEFFPEWKIIRFYISI